jgi:protein gp37
VGDTNIQWTDKVWNPTTGCTRVSPECKNCYAFALHDMRHAAHKAGKQVPAQYAKPFTELQMFDDRLGTPLSWRKPCRVFVNSMSDLFHEDVPDLFIQKVFGVMSLCGQHTFQVLTKRPERMARWFAENTLCQCQAELCVNGPGVETTPTGKSRVRDTSAINGTRGPTVGDGNHWPLPNVWLGVSVGTRRRKDWIDVLRQVPAAVRFVSFEPLLEDLGPLDLAGIGWAIVGGESGPGSRPLRPEWVRRIVNQCRDAGVPAFVKQFGANIVDRNDAGFDGCNLGGWPACEEYGGLIRVEENINGFREEYQGADVRVRLPDKKGGNPDEWPADLRVREFPESARA